MKSYILFFLTIFSSNILDAFSVTIIGQTGMPKDLRLDPDYKKDLIKKMDQTYAQLQPIPYTQADKQKDSMKFVLAGIASSALTLCLSHKLSAVKRSALTGVVATAIGARGYTSISNHITFPEDFAAKKTRWQSRDQYEANDFHFIKRYQDHLRWLQQNKYFLAQKPS